MIEFCKLDNASIGVPDIKQYFAHSILLPSNPCQQSYCQQRVSKSTPSGKLLSKKSIEVGITFKQAAGLTNS